LQRVVNAQRRAARVGGREARNQAGLGGFQQVEGDEEEENHHAQRPQPRRTRRQHQQGQLHHEQQCNADAQHRAQLPAPLGREQAAQHEERGQHRRQVHVPVLRFLQPRLHQQPRHHHPHRHLHRVQHEHAQVQPPQVGVQPHVGQAPARRVGLVSRLGRRPPQHHGDAGHGQRGGDPEQAGQANRPGQRRRRHQRQREHRRDADAHQRHAFGSHLVARQIGQQRRDGRRHRARALDGAADDQHVYVARQRRHYAAHREHDEADHDDLLAPHAVGRQPQRHLHDRLRQAVDAHRQPDQRRVVAAGQARGLQREHRQHQEQPQHAQREDARQRQAGAALVGRHAVGGGRRRGRGGRGHQVQAVFWRRITPAAAHCR